METHGGRLPPNPAVAPTLAEQLNSDWRSLRKNGYDFRVDIIDRTRRISGELSVASSMQRSRRIQAQAGGPDRLPTDDGGHFIAARFNGPRNSFNHFAQNASFNRGAYRVIEDSWARDIKSGRRVFVDIIPRYEDTSNRPSRLTVIWYVDGERNRQDFPNARKGK